VLVSSIGFRPIWRLSSVFILFIFIANAQNAQSGKRPIARILLKKIAMQFHGEVELHGYSLKFAGKENKTSWSPALMPATARHVGYLNGIRVFL
jgi:hypothetical protein